MPVNVPQQGNERRPVVGAVVLDPATDDRIHHLRQVLHAREGSTMKASIFQFKQ
jgi:hypothetical protein